MFMMPGIFKKTFIILGVILLVIIGQVWISLDGKYPIVNFPPKSATIVAFGDSLTVGVGASAPEKNYISLLENRLNMHIENRGLSGDTTRSALVRLDTDVTPLHPGIVIILLGGNDYLQKVPQEETFSNLEQIIRKIQSEKAVVLLIGVRGGLLHDKWDDAFAMLAAKTGSVFVSNILDGIIGDARLMSDEVHPNDAGYLKMADKIAPALEGLVLSMQKSAQ